MTCRFSRRNIWLARPRTPAARDGATNVRRTGTWLPWLLGAALLAVVVFAARHFTEERAFVRLLEQAEPTWLLAALALQVATYLAQAGTWLAVLHRTGARVPFAYACGLSL
jgi:Mg2+-importing ATPase